MNAEPLDFHAIEKLVDRVTYKPGFELRARQRLSHLPTIRMTAWVQDTRSTIKRNVHIEAEQSVPLMIPNEKEFYHWLLFAFLHNEWERHEAAEWFRVDGQRIFDPHK